MMKIEIVLVFFISLNFIQGKRLSWGQSEDDVGAFIQLTDIHVDFDYVEGSYADCFSDITTLPCCHSWEIPRRFRLAGKFGDYNCDTPEVTINETLKAIAKLGYRYDFMLWTGDSPDHSDFSQSESINLKSIKRISDLIDSFLPGVVVFPSFGNHDTWPIDQLADPPYYGWLKNGVADYWKKWLPNEEQQKTLKYGGYFSVAAAPGLRIISVNTLYYDAINILARGDDPAGQWAWLSKELVQARANNEKVYIIAHVYPGNEEAREEYSKRYESLINNYTDIILGQFFGHSHKDQLLFLKNASAITSMAYIAPSVTTFAEMNPSYRIYFYNRKTFEIIDYEQYYMNLTEANLNKKASFQLNYRATQFFDIPQLSLDGWKKVLNKMHNDPIFWNDYWKQVWNGYVPVGDCLEKCRQNILCEIESATRTALKSCKFMADPENVLASD